MASVDPELEAEAGYGCNPFDIFVLEHWESTTPEMPTDHHQRWNELARRYQSLSLLERWPLYKRIEDAMAGISGAAPLPSPTREQIDEIFVPHQTIEEREISRKFNSGWNAVWLRTCYKPSMAQRYFELARLAGAEYEGGCVESLNHVLDDHSLYDLQGSEQGVLDQLLLRMPGLTDGSGIMDEYGDGSELVYGSTIYQSEREGDVRDLGNRVQNYVYVADEEAIEKSRVKIWWFDEFGKIIWDSYAGIPDSDLDGLRGAIMDGQGFLEIVGEDGKRGDRIDR